MTMPSSNQTMYERERQYRPTYNSIPKFGVPSNFGAPVHTSIQATLRERRNMSMQDLGRNKVDLHSAPTVATSGITASTSGYFTHHAYANILLTPTRIPTPTRATLAGIPSQQANYYTVDHDRSGTDYRNNQPPKTEVPGHNKYDVHGEKLAKVPSSHKSSEYFLEVSSQMGSVDTDAVQAPTLTRARTFQVLASLTNSFSLTSLPKVPSQVSLKGNPSSTSRSTSGPATFFPRSPRPSSPIQLNRASVRSEDVDLREVRTGMPQSYWAGRYMALDDKFRNELFNIDYHDSLTVFEVLKEIEKRGYTSDGDDSLSESDEILFHRIFAELNSYCLTTDAKMSLWSFQQAYARNLNCHKLLPVGGTIQEKENMLTRAGRFFTKSRAKSVLNDKKSTKKDKNAEAKMFKKAFGRPSMLNLSHRRDEVMDALRERELWEAGVNM